MEPHELTIKVKTNEDSSLDVLFDGELLATRGMKCRIVSAIMASLDLDESDIGVVKLMLKAGLTDDHITGTAIRVTFKPE